MDMNSIPEGVRFPSTDSSSFILPNASEHVRTSSTSPKIPFDPVPDDGNVHSSPVSNAKKHLNIQNMDHGARTADTKPAMASAHTTPSTKPTDNGNNTADIPTLNETSGSKKSTNVDYEPTFLRDPFASKGHVDAVDENTFSPTPFSSSSRFVRSETTTDLKGRFAPASAGKGPATLSYSHTRGQPQRQPFVTAATYAEHLALVYFRCHMCRQAAQDPVHLIHAHADADAPEGGLACRACAVRGGAPFQELPAVIAAAVRDVCAKAGMGTGARGRLDRDAPDELGDHRRTVKVVRATARAAGEAGAPLEEGHASTRDTGPQGTFAAPPRTGGGAKGLAPTRVPMPGEGGTENANQGRGGEEVGQTGQAPGGARGSATWEQSRQWSASGQVGKGDSNTENTGLRVESRPEGLTSRQIKMEADKKYEDAEYAAAIELYTRAIKVQPLDKATQLKNLYGNRSAAYFMDHRYAECVSDCLEVVSLDPKDARMIVRAARSAATMGDLSQAVEILEKTPPEHLTDAISIELSKYKSGLDIYQRAEQNFGTPDGDERYRMLVAQLSDAVPFRVRCAESLMKQGQYTKAVEALDVVAFSARTTKLCKVMATCLYQSGFEFFERARLCLAESSQRDSECAELLKLIELVEDGKQKGNDAFATKEFSTAVAEYTTAIQLAAGNDQVLRILYCNRAAAHKELGNYRDGIDDCCNAIALDKDFFKAYARRARCYQHLGDNFAAIQDFKKALEYDPSNRELARELKSAEYSLSREAELEKDLYYQLGLRHSATEKEIKAKYRELSLRWHPDKCIGLSAHEKDRSEHKFKIISEAYATLINPSKRRDYDLKMSRERLSHSGMGGSFSATCSGLGEYAKSQTRHRAGPGGFW